MTRYRRELQEFHENGIKIKIYAEIQAQRDFRKFLEYGYYYKTMNAFPKFIANFNSVF